MENSYLNDEYTRMIRRIYENIENAKNLYNNLPSVIRQHSNSLMNYTNTLGMSLNNALTASKELMENYGID